MKNFATNNNLKEIHILSNKKLTETEKVELKRKAKLNRWKYSKRYL